MIDLSRAGAIERPDGEGRAGGGACDDRVRFTIALERGQLAAVRFGADACPSTTAAAAWLAATAEGASLLDAARLGAVAAHAACGVAAPAGPASRSPSTRSTRRSATPSSAARPCREPAGSPWRCRAASTRPSRWPRRRTRRSGSRCNCGSTRTRPTPTAPAALRAACAGRAISATSAGFRTCRSTFVDTFRDTIVAGFIAGYEAGETPNPCTACNGDFRLRELVDAAARLGAARVRTGHYARIVERDGVPLVARGVDPAKDQSYMLARVPTEVLARLDFPLGDRTKPEVRERAAGLGLAAARAKESQEVCFLGGGDYRTFLDRYGSPAADGPIEDEAGHELGRHAGVGGFTPGQRRGIGVSAPEPLYVLRTEPARSAVVVAPLRRLGTRSVPLRDVVMHVERRRVDAKLRYRSPAVAAALEGDGSDRTLALERDLFAIAPGQTAALYDGDAVVGCGTIA